RPHAAAVACRARARPRRRQRRRPQRYRERLEGSALRSDLARLTSIIFHIIVELSVEIEKYCGKVSKRNGKFCFVGTGRRNGRAASRARRNLRKERIMSAIETAPAQISWTASETTPSTSEDWLSVIIGLFIFVLALAALANVDLIGW